VHREPVVSAETKAPRLDSPRVAQPLEIDRSPLKLPLVLRPLPGIVVPASIASQCVRYARRSVSPTRSSAARRDDTVDAQHITGANSSEHGSVSAGAPRPPRPTP
jgi:hypothetical protein